MFPGGDTLRLVEETLRLRETPLKIRLLGGHRGVRLRSRAASLIERPVRLVQIAMQRLVLRGKRRVFACRGTLRHGRGIGEFRQPTFEFRLGRFRGAAFLIEREIRLREARLQLFLRVAEPHALLIRKPHDFGALRLRDGQPVLELVAHLRELETFLIRGPLRLLQRAERRRETSVDFIALGGQRHLLRVPVVARLLQRGQHLGELAIEFRARLRVRDVFCLRRLARLRKRAVRRGEALLRLLRRRAQCPLLLPCAPRRIGHRLVEIRDTAFDLRTLAQKRRALLVRRARGLGKRLLARCDLRVRGRELLAHLLKFRGDRALRVLVLRLKIRQLR